MDEGRNGWWGKSIEGRLSAKKIYRRRSQSKEIIKAWHRKGLRLVLKGRDVQPVSTEQLLQSLSAGLPSLDIPLLLFNLLLKVELMFQLALATLPCRQRILTTLVLNLLLLGGIGRELAKLVFIVITKRLGTGTLANKDCRDVLP